MKISPKFQVVIPREIRESLKIRAGSSVEVIAKGGVVYVVPIEEVKALQEKLSPYLKQEGLRDEVDRLL